MLKINIYSLKIFIKTFLIVNLSVVFIFVIYKISYFFITFKEKSFEILVDYMVNNLIVSFFYALPITTAISFFIFNNFLRKIKLLYVIESFGLKPFSVLKYVLNGSIFIVLLSLFVNQFLLPYAITNLKVIEHVYQKKQEYTDQIVTEFRFVQKDKNNIEFFKSNVAYSYGLFFNTEAVLIQNGHIAKIIKSEKALLKNKEIEFFKPKIVELYPTFYEHTSNDFLLEANIKKEDIQKLAKPIDGLSLTDLIFLIQKLNYLGLNISPYISYLVFRIGYSFLPFIIISILIFYSIKSTSSIELYKNSLITLFLIGLSIGFFFSVSSKSGSSFLLTMVPYLFWFIFAIKKLFNLVKY